MRPFAVFDLDGTLADTRHRLHHLGRRPPDWDAFFAAAPDDPLLPDGVALVLESARDCEVVYLSGRPERCREDTLTWLRRHDLPEGRLLLRREGDRRPARVAKPARLRRLAEEGVVAVVVDDDPEVCAVLARTGHTVLQATWQEPSPALARAQEVDGRT